jgi:hypothetical protein
LTIALLIGYGFCSFVLLIGTINVSSMLKKFVCIIMNFFLFLAGSNESFIFLNSWLCFNSGTRICFHHLFSEYFADKFPHNSAHFALHHNFVVTRINERASKKNWD